MEILNLEYVKSRMNGVVPMKVDTSGVQYEDDEKIEETIKEAESLVLSYCRMVGIDILDLSVETAIELRPHAFNIFLYNISENTLTDVVKEKYEKSIKYLNDVADGRAVLRTKISKRSGFRTIRLNI